MGDKQGYEEILPRRRVAQRAEFTSQAMADLAAAGVWPPKD
ncbi:MAG: hypothetical protein ABI630_08890 [Betaproteobacteria bacterium]